MKGSLHTIWRWFKWPVFVVIAAFVGLVIYRLPLAFDKQRTAEAVAYIHSRHITLADAQGTNLPPVPDQAENDATVAGLDKNDNGIRDDVELAIFKKYPNAIKARAAALQYAMTEQMFLTQVVNVETWKAVAEENSRAASCVFENNVSRKEIQTLVSNTQFRKDEREKAFEFIVGHGDAPGKTCDVSS